MNVAAIGIGGAGGRIVNRLVRLHGVGTSSPIASVDLVDTDSASLDALGAVPSSSKHAVGQFQTGGDGTGGDRELGMEIIEDQGVELRRTVEDGITTAVDSILLVGGLGGGTASAVMPELASGLETVYTQSIYTVSILPAESEASVRSNAATALAKLERTVDSQVVCDNDAWLWGDRSLDSHQTALNRAYTHRLRQLLTTGQVDSGSTVGEQVVDASDLMGTLDGGGISTLGHARTDLSRWKDGDDTVLEGLKRRIFGEDVDEVTQERAIYRTLQWATRGTLTFECPYDHASRGLVVFSGPPEWLRRDAVSRGREWFTDRTGVPELRIGDRPTPGADSISVFVVLAGVTGTSRIQNLGTD